MVEDETSPELTNRRTVLQLATLAGGAGMLPTGVSATGSGGPSRSDGVVLGDFESDLDGWRTNGGNELSRVTGGEFPAGVTSGGHGLVVEVNGDAYPMIENTRRVRGADLVNNPYLRMDVLAAAEGTDSNLVFTFRLHHTTGASGGGNGGESSRSKDVLVEESAEMPVAQLRPQTVQWDMSGLSEDVRRTAKRLEIVWYLEDHEPDSGHRGKSTGGFDYRGLVVFDDIRLAGSPPISEEGEKQRLKTTLHREHGMIIERAFEERSEGFERGRLIFVDGYEAPYSFEVVGDDRFIYTIDGERFEIGGGWT